MQAFILFYYSKIQKKKFLCSLCLIELTHHLILFLIIFVINICLQRQMLLGIYTSFFVTLFPPPPTCPPLALRGLEQYPLFNKSNW